MSINIYCDESSYILNDKSPIMTLGAIQYPENNIRELSLEIKSIKEEYNCRGELKWTKVSMKNILFYLRLIDLFETKRNLNFRAIIIHDKDKLDHKLFNDGSHDNFYYKMYYELLRNIIENNPDDSFKIYLDIKDTRSSEKVRKLHEILSNKFYDFNMEKVCNIQQIRSNESNILQLCDFLLGAVTYTNKGLYSNAAKLQVSETIEKKLGFNLKMTTPPWELKFNLFHFSPRAY